MLSPGSCWIHFFIFVIIKPTKGFESDHTISSFRLIVGGMFGSKTWKDQKNWIGPQFVQMRSCNFDSVDGINKADDKKDKSLFIKEVAARIIINEVVNLVHEIRLVAVVLCGLEGNDECLSMDVLEKISDVDKVIPIWACPNLGEDNENDENSI